MNLVHMTQSDVLEGFQDSRRDGWRRGFWAGFVMGSLVTIAVLGFGVPLPRGKMV